MATFAAQNETTLLASSLSSPPPLSSSSLSEGGGKPPKISQELRDPASVDEAPACVLSGTRLQLKATAEEEARQKASAPEKKADEDFVDGIIGGWRSATAEEEARQKATAPEKKADEDFVDEQKRTWAQVMEALEYMGIPIPRRTQGSPTRKIGDMFLIFAIAWYEKVQLRIHPDKTKSSPLPSEVSDEQRSRVVEAGDTFKHAKQHGWWANDRDCGCLAVVARNRVPWKPLHGMMPPRPDFMNEDFMNEIREMFNCSPELRDLSSEDDAPASVLSGASRKRARQTADPAPPNLAPQREEHRLAVVARNRVAKYRRAYIKKTKRIAKQLKFRRRRIASWGQGAVDKEACQETSATVALPRPWPTQAELNEMTHDEMSQYRRQVADSLQASDSAEGDEGDSEDRAIQAELNRMTHDEMTQYRRQVADSQQASDSGEGDEGDSEDRGPRANEEADQERSANASSSSASSDSEEQPEESIIGGCRSSTEALPWPLLQETTFYGRLENDDPWIPFRAPAGTPAGLPRLPPVVLGGGSLSFSLSLSLSLSLYIYNKYRYT